MALYIGDRIRLHAAEVEPGHRLVHQDARDGWIEVEEVGRRAGGEIVLHFANGEEDSYEPGDVLFRVAS